MRIEIDVTMDYQLAVDEPVLLSVEAAQTDGQSIAESALDIESATLTRIGDPGVDQRVWAMVTGDRLRLRYCAQVDVTRPTVSLERLAASPMHRLPRDVLTYLRPSRLCPSDLFMAFVSQKFGHLDGGAKIASMLEWIATEISYTPASSNAATTAIDTFVNREGVCRDYTHLVCGLARAAGIPARYTSVYGPGVTPRDFHAVAEIWLDDAWHLVDATGMCSAGEMVAIGSGRDAGDVAFMETENWATLINQKVTVSQQ